MQYTQFLLAGLIFVAGTCAFSQTQSKELEANQVIHGIYHKLNSTPNQSTLQRIKFVSKALLDKPYNLGALGEGAGGNYDQAPLYRVDGFDCETYVDTVLAIALSTNLDNFKQCIKAIRYENGKVGYLTRNHFASLDWNLNNQKIGITKDITASIVNPKNQPVAKMATAVIDKPAWYAKKSTDTIRIESISSQEKQQLLGTLKNKGSHLPITSVSIPYIPLTALFDKEGQPNQSIFNQIPDGSIIEIVRPNWDLKKSIGTCLNVSHLGFAIRENNQLLFREASSTQKHTIDIPLTTYLSNARSSPTIKGINVQIVLPQKPLEKGC